MLINDLFAIKPFILAVKPYILVILGIFGNIYRLTFCCIRIKKYRHVIIFYRHFLWGLSTVFKLISLCQSTISWNGKLEQLKNTQKMAFCTYEVADSQQDWCWPMVNKCWLFCSFNIFVFKHVSELSPDLKSCLDRHLWSIKVSAYFDPSKNRKFPCSTLVPKG